MTGLERQQNPNAEGDPTLKASSAESEPFDPLALASPRATKALLEAHGLAPKKRWGQNFLVSRWVLERILECAQLGPKDAVLEIGPGLGTLTRALLGRCAAVVAVEADCALLPLLKESCAFGKDRLAVVCGDALRVAPAELVRALAQVLEGARGPGRGEAPALLSKFVSNLPYGIAATAILREFSQLASLERAVVMVQREVASRMCAAPGTKTYGAYTVKLALRARVAGRFEVGRQEFWPPPHVDSAVLTLTRRKGWDEERARSISAVVDAAFAQRRKTLANSLAAQGYERALVEAALVAMGLDAKTRAERLAPAQFGELAQRLGAFGDRGVPGGVSPRPHALGNLDDDPKKGA